MKILLLAGAVLVAVSVPPIALVAREIWIGSQLADRYVVLGGAIRGEIHGHVVALEDDQPFNETGGVQDGQVRILVDGRDYSSPASAIIRLSRRDSSRYWGYVYLMRVTDRQTHEESLIAAQSLGVQGFRTVSVSADGRVLEDRFGYASRCDPPTRALFIRWVVPHPIGYCSDVMTMWPGIFYPLLYPFASAALGLGCLAAALVRRAKARARALHHRD